MAVSCQRPSHKHYFQNDLSRFKKLGKTVIEILHTFQIFVRISGTRGQSLLLCNRMEDFSRHWLDCAARSRHEADEVWPKKIGFNV